MQDYYYSFNRYLSEKFGARVQRVSVNAGFGCPNRDGTLGSDGCIFCNEEGFANFPAARLGLHEQIRSSMAFFRQRFKAEKFILYFQNASNTHASVAQLKEAFDVVRDFPEMVGLFIATRPDCVDEEKLDLIATYSGDYDVWIEYGLQSSNDATLAAINRSHTFARFKDAVMMTAQKNLKSSCHVIVGLPQEGRSEIIETAQQISRLPLRGVKIHALHVVKETKLAQLYQAGSVRLLGPEEYIGLVCDFLEHLNPGFVIMRLVSNAKPEVLIAPQWINNKQKMLDAIEAEFKRRKTKQGIYYAQ